MRGVATALLACVLSGCALAHHSNHSARILVLNIHAGKDAAGADNLERVASLIRSTDADLVLLQEVDRGTKRSGGVDQVGRLQELTSYDSAFGPSLSHYDGGEYGIAILTREEIGFHATTPLRVNPVQTRAGGSHEPRVALALFANVRGAVWRAINTHLDPAEGDARAQEIAKLLEVVREEASAGTPLVVGGDFNSTPDAPVLQPLLKAGLRDSWTECGQGDGFTYPADQPAKRIDYLFLAGNLRCASAQVLDLQISDHRPLLVTIR